MIEGGGEKVTAVHMIRSTWKDRFNEKDTRATSWEGRLRAARVGVINLLQNHYRITRVAVHEVNMEIETIDSDIWVRKVFGF